MQIVYFIQHPDDGYIKIGTTGNLANRLAQLRKEYSQEIKLLGICVADQKREKEIHEIFSKYWRFGEWFKPSPELLEFIRDNTYLELPLPALNKIDFQEKNRAKAAREQRGSEKITEGAIASVNLLVDTGITLIANNHIYYQGIDVFYLVDKHSIEEVAALIWKGDLSELSFCDTDPNSIAIPYRNIHHLLVDIAPLEKFNILFPLMNAYDLKALDLRLSNVVGSGISILRLMVESIAKGDSIERGIAQTLQRIWSPNDVRVEHLISAAIILCIDWIVDLPTFVAREQASRGATVYEALITGLATFKGSKFQGQLGWSNYSFVRSGA